MSLMASVLRLLMGRQSPDDESQPEGIILMIRHVCIPGSPQDIDKKSSLSYMHVEPITNLSCHTLTRLGIPVRSGSKRWRQ